MTPQQLKRMMPRSDAAKWCAPLNTAMEKYEINTVKRQAGFIATIAVETAGMTVFVENLNYKATGLCDTWPKRFPSIEAAKPYAHNPQKLANHVYCNRNGNGDEASGEGWLFRGRGLIQTTGKNNYLLIQKELQVDLLSSPDTILLPVIGSLAAAFLFAKLGGNAQCDKDNDVGIRKCINGGTIGLKEFKVYYPKFKQILGETPTGTGGGEVVAGEEPVFGAV